MPSDSRRKATIADAMLLTAGAAISFACWRAVLGMPVWNGFPDSLQWYYFQALGLVAFLAPLSLTLLVIALRPSPRLRQVAPEPAGVVGLSTLFVLTVNTALLCVAMGLVGFSMATFTGGKVLYYCRLMAEQIGMAVGSIWLIQAVSGQFRRPSDWIDAIAFLLGACWILLALASIVFTLM
jgi:hypothetical protein